MTWEQIGAGIVAVIVFAWPKLVAGVKLLLDRISSFRVAPTVAVVPHPAGGPVGYEAAIHNLALVRSRLNATDHLGEEKSPERAAIDTLTLALVAGSDI
jgi:hypothetical protein